MMTMLRPVARRVRRLCAGNGRPSSSREAVFERWRTLSCELLSASHFAEAGLDDIWERNPPKLDRQIIVMQALRNVIRAGLEGDLCELGCFRGHTAIQIVQTMRALGDSSRLWLFDSFQGINPFEPDASFQWLIQSHQNVYLKRILPDVPNGDGRLGERGQEIALGRFKFD